MINECVGKILALFLVFTLEGFTLIYCRTSSYTEGVREIERGGLLWKFD